MKREEVSVINHLNTEYAADGNYAIEDLVVGV